MLDSLCDIQQLPPAYQILMKEFWPGSLTLLFPVLDDALPSIVTAKLRTVGVRMPSHPLARALIATAKCPVAAPSSNASGRPSPTCAQHVYYDLGGPLDRALASSKDPSGRVRLILDGGPAGVGLESTVIDGLTHPQEIRVLRPGGVAVEAIESALSNAGLLGTGEGQVAVRVYGRDMARDPTQEATPSTPGMKYRHYSPNAPVLAVDVLRQGSAPTLDELLSREYQALVSAGKVRDTVQVGLMVAQASPLLSALQAKATARQTLPDGVTQYTLPLLPSAKAEVYVYDMGSSAADEAARRLFGGLRYLDEQVGVNGGGCEFILVETVPRNRIGLAVMNRLDKAASERVQVVAP